jgi:hypothetical protein
LRDQAVTMPLDSLVIAALGRVILGLVRMGLGHRHQVGPVTAPLVLGRGMLMPGDILIVQADRGGVDFQGFLAPQRG